MVEYIKPDDGCVLFTSVVTDSISPNSWVIQITLIWLLVETLQILAKLCLSRVETRLSNRAVSAHFGQWTLKLYCDRSVLWSCLPLNQMQRNSFKNARIEARLSWCYGAVSAQFGQCPRKVQRSDLIGFMRAAYPGVVTNEKLGQSAMWGQCAWQVQRVTYFNMHWKENCGLIYSLFISFGT